MAATIWSPPVLPQAHIEALHASFDRQLRAADRSDGQWCAEPSVAGPLAGLTLPALLETLKPVFDETDPEAENRGFHAALAIARSFVEAKIAKSAAKLRAEGLVLQAIDAIRARRAFWSSRRECPSVPPS